MHTNIKIKDGKELRLQALVDSKCMLWQPLITKTNDHTSGKSLKLDIKWEVHKRT